MDAMPMFTEYILDRFPPELAAKCLPEGRRLLIYRTCKRLHTLLPSLGLGIALRLTDRPKNLPTLLAKTSRKFRLKVFCEFCKDCSKCKVKTPKK